MISIIDLTFVLISYWVMRKPYLNIFNLENHIQALHINIVLYLYGTPRCSNVHRLLTKLKVTHDVTRYIKHSIIKLSK